MTDAVTRFRSAAEVLGIEIEVATFPQGTRTAEDAARAVGCHLAQIVKSLVFMADDAPVLALTSGANRVDTDALARLAGATTVRRATPEEARAATGFAVGGTPPFGHSVAVRTFLDRDLTGHAVVWAAAGSPEAVFPISPGDLLRAASAEVADLRA